MKNFEWKDISIEPEKKSEVLYFVAVITESGKKKVATALCFYEKKRNKYFWEIQHTEYDIAHGKIVAYAKMPSFPKELTA